MQVESSASTQNDVTHERNSTAILAAHEGASHASSLDEATSQFPDSAPNIPELQGALNHQDGILTNPPTTPHSAPEMQQNPVSYRIEDSIALRDAQGYQIRRPSGSDNMTTRIPRRSDAGDDARLYGNASGPRASVVKPSGRNVEICCEPLDPARRSSLPMLFSRAGWFRISYGKLLIFNLTTQVLIRVLMVICVNGHLGQPGFIFAGVSLTLLMVYNFMNIVFRVVHERKELRLRAEESA